MTSRGAAADRRGDPRIFLADEEARRLADAVKRSLRSGGVPGPHRAVEPQLANDPRLYGLHPRMSAAMQDNTLLPMPVPDTDTGPSPLDPRSFSDHNASGTLHRARTVHADARAKLEYLDRIDASRAAAELRAATREVDPSIWRSGVPKPPITVPISAHAAPPPPLPRSDPTGGALGGARAQQASVGVASHAKVANVDQILARERHRQAAAAVAKGQAVSQQVHAAVHVAESRIADRVRAPLSPQTPTLSVGLEGVGAFKSLLAPSLQRSARLCLDGYLRSSLRGVVCRWEHRWWWW
jgi:hypothetical protein